MSDKCEFCGKEMMDVYDRSDPFSEDYAYWEWHYCSPECEHKHLAAKRKNRTKNLEYHP